VNVQPLSTLKDIDGVYGSFVVDKDGRLRARDLPSVFDDVALGDSGPRIVRLWEVVSEDEVPEYTLIEFAEYWLFLRPVPGGSLCVIVPPNVNVSALRMAASLVAKRFDLDAPPLEAPAPAPVANPFFEFSAVSPQQPPPLEPPPQQQALKRTLFWGKRRS
jgi:hypothetical protein